MGKIILEIILLAISIGAFIISFRSFKEKGILINNAYRNAAEPERDSMNKKPYYRQTAIVFLLIGIIFLLNAADIILSINWLSYLAIAVEMITVVYVIISFVTIEKKK